MADEHPEDETTSNAQPTLTEDLYSVAGSEVAAVLRAAHDAALETTRRAHGRSEVLEEPALGGIHEVQGFRHAGGVDRRGRRPRTARVGGI